MWFDTSVRMEYRTAALEVEYLPVLALRLGIMMPLLDWFWRTWARRLYRILRF